MTLLELDGITVQYGSLTAVDDLSLSVERGELLCLLGPSGCGKSTTLRTIAGFERPDAGRVRLAEGGAPTDVTGTAPNDRDTAMVFQDWALFPNKTVRENVAFGLKMAGVADADRQARAEEMLSLVEMTDHAGADPTQLSGGQKQRVALARSLAVDPTLLLLDEPLSNLDRRLREDMQLELNAIHDRLETTMVYVTHDQDEAFTLADRIAVVNDGSVEQVGPPASVYTDPETLFVESFLGTTNLVDCTVRRAQTPAEPADAQVADGGRVALETPLGEPLFAPATETAVSEDDHVTASLRPEQLSVETVDTTGTETGDASEGDGLATTGTVDSRLHRGSQVRYEITVGEETLVTHRRIAERLGVGEGERVAVACSASAISFFDAGGRRLR
ncbi:MAG: ABC-type spermidine/putrescine transport system, ATPase component [halophilic archaeon J07HB67]|jgi:ABC-type spermidine/putrescine transport systems, ATPase components|nr:MAG: ABC-type spermidine/putrescine transport system, ATPase component [halophilic archaeon J07HB67]